MTLSVKNGRYISLIRLDLMFSMSWWKEFQLLEILNKLSIKHLNKPILYETDAKLLKFKRKIGRYWLKRKWLHIYKSGLVSLL